MNEEIKDKYYYYGPLQQFFGTPPDHPVHANSTFIFSLGLHVRFDRWSVRSLVPGFELNDVCFTPIRGSALPFRKSRSLDDEFAKLIFRVKPDGGFVEANGAMAILSVSNVTNSDLDFWGVFGCVDRARELAFLRERLEALSSSDLPLADSMLIRASYESAIARLEES